MKLGLLITAGPVHQEVRSALGLARAARAKGWEVDLFLMEDGVGCAKAGARAPVAQQLAQLLEQGVRVSLCAYNAELRGLGREEVVPGIVWGSQYDLAQIVSGCDRFLYFG